MVSTAILRTTGQFHAGASLIKAPLWFDVIGNEKIKTIIQCLLNVFSAWLKCK
jgi:hypothetical protein